MINLKIICFFDDVELSMNLVPICNNNNYEIIFPNYENFHKDINNIAIGVVIIDILKGYVAVQCISSFDFWNINDSNNIPLMKIACGVFIGASY